MSIVSRSWLDLLICGFNVRSILKVFVRYFRVIRRFYLLFADEIFVFIRNLECTGSLRCS